MKKLICVILALGMFLGGSLVVYASAAMDTTGTGISTQTRPDPDEDFGITAVPSYSVIMDMTRPDPDEDF